ncbi:Protein phosphatase 1 regulatory subunit 14B [Collichthys lucidus]|uniref:Protein phosphatase 1 regulatory subunit 14B n=1 Tax=Collichthys lucidus TaxID=240159 RepID=A0A4U5VFP3_COLLU|nr:Protein phosphatase 1 regulatory subunit 14B [Collichthys lucidus]
MASEPSTQSRVMFQAADKTEEPAHRKLGKLTVKYNRKICRGGWTLRSGSTGSCTCCLTVSGVDSLTTEEEIPELEIDIDELLELTDEGQRTRLQDFINGLLYRIKGLRKMSGPLKK